MELLGHRRQELPRDRGVALDERPEVPRRHAVADHVGRGGDRRRPVGAGEEGDLAEVVAGADRAAGRALHGDPGLAGLDDEEAGAARALGGHRVAGGEAPLAQRPRDLVQLAVVEAAEQRHLLQHVGGGPGHGGVIPRNRSRYARAPVSDTIRPVKLTVVGCSPAWPNPGGAQSGYLVEGEGRVLLDCGPGVLARLRARESWPRVDALVLTHFDLGHWGDLVPAVFCAPFA